MSEIVRPSIEYLYGLIEPYLTNQPAGLAFVIGYASPSFPESESLIYINGNLANQFKQSLDLNNDTYFEIAAMSKTFTALLCAAFGSQYQPSWQTQKIKDYLNGAVVGGPPVQPQFGPIPLTTLLNFTSGLPNDSDLLGGLPLILPKPYSPAAMLGYLNMTPLRVQGTGSQYTNSALAFSILSQIISLFKTNGSREFTSLMQEWILDPLKLHGTHFFDFVPLDELCLGYSYAAPNPIPSKVAPGYPAFDAYYGASGLISTPSDLMTWLKFNMGMQLAPLSRFLKLLQSPATSVPGPSGDGLGLGWFLSPPSSLQPVGAVWMAGELSGFSSYITFLPWVESDSASQAGVFVLTNCDGLVATGTEVDVAAAIATDVLAVMQGISPT